MDDLNEWQRPHTPVPEELLDDLVRNPRPSPSPGLWSALRRLLCRHHWTPLGRGYVLICRCGKVKRMW